VHSTLTRRCTSTRTAMGNSPGAVNDAPLELCLFCHLSLERLKFYPRIGGRRCDLNIACVRRFMKSIKGTSLPRESSNSSDLTSSPNCPATIGCFIVVGFFHILISFVINSPRIHEQHFNRPSSCYDHFSGEPCSLQTMRNII